MALHLSLDTAMSRPCAAIMNETTALAEWMGPPGLRHHETLLEGIDSALKQSGKKLSDLAFITAGIGPGLFTGLRVGITTAKFLAETQGIPCVPVSSLLSLAWQVHSHTDKTIWVMSDARSHRVYSLKLSPGTFPQDFDSLEGEDIALAPEELAKKVNSGDYLYGEGAALYANLFPQAKLMIDIAHELSATSVGYLGAKRFALGKTCDALDLQPKYLKTGNL